MSVSGVAHSAAHQKCVPGRLHLAVPPCLVPTLGDDPLGGMGKKTSRHAGRFRPGQSVK